MRRSNLLYYLLITFAVIFLDQISKILIVRHIAEGSSVSVIGDLLYFRFIYNEGGAMGTFLGPPWIYAILTVLAMVLIIRYIIITPIDKVFSKISLALILGGAIGNLVDRLKAGKVVDFIDLDIPDIPFLHLYRWFTFNIADAAITVGLILFGISVLFAKKSTDENGAHLPEAQAPEAPGDSR
jgi:signal peptidase II